MKKTQVRCPQCKTMTAWEDNPFRPFCSERCRLLDLGKWASEEYRIAGGKVESARGEENEKNDEDV